MFFWPKKYKKDSVEFATKLIKMKVSPEKGLKILEEVDKIISGPKPRAHAACIYCLYRGIGEEFEE